MLESAIHIKEGALDIARLNIKEVEENRKLLLVERNTKILETQTRIQDTQMNRELAQNTRDS